MEKITPCIVCLVIDPTGVYPASKALDLALAEGTLRMYLCEEHNEYAQKVAAHMVRLPVLTNPAAMTPDQAIHALENSPVTDNNPGGTEETLKQAAEEWNRRGRPTPPWATDEAQEKAAEEWDAPEDMKTSTEEWR